MRYSPLSFVNLLMSMGFASMVSLRQATHVSPSNNSDLDHWRSLPTKRDSGDSEIRQTFNQTTHVRLRYLESIHPALHVPINDAAAGGGQSDTTRRISPVCRPSFPTKEPIERIYMAHMRKAGGTTIKRFLEMVADEYDLDLDVVEAEPLEVPGSRADTLYVTHLRDPVKRVISNFKYEVRWRCHDLMKNKSFVPTLENARDLPSWIDRVACPSDEWKLWRCSSNCYIQWLNFEREQDCQPEDHVVGSSRFQEARDKAFKYNVIIDSDRLFRDHDYGHALERFFGMKRGLVRDQTRGIFCEKNSKRANQMVPLVVEDSTYDDLKRRNEADYRLYNELMDCHEYGIEFPRNRTLASYVE